MVRFVALFLLVSPLVAQDASAQTVEDLDATPTKQKRNGKKGTKNTLESEVIHEVERGFYLKAGGGTGFYVGRYGGVLSAVSHAPISFGQDFVDNEKTSMAWELTFGQALYHGTPYQNQVELPPNRRIQGDTHFFQFGANYEFSSYVTRRLGLGFRAGGGVYLSPLLMDKAAYEQAVVAEEWGGQANNVHSTPHPYGLLGFALEYYTKLSHFSIGLDADVLYALGLDLNIAPVAYLKYTF